MSTLSQFFNSAASSGAGGVSYFGTSGTLTVPSDVTYIAYGAMGAGARGSCVNRCGAAGGGFSWWEGPVNCGSPFTITATVGASGPTGGTSIVSGGPNMICATGGQTTAGGIGYCGLINTCGGIGSCYYTVCWDGYRTCYRCCVINGGGAGGLMGNGGNSQAFGGGGFGSGGGGGWNSGFGGALGTPSGPGLNGEVGTPGYSVSYNLNGKLSQAKTFLSASGGGAGVKNMAGQSGSTTCNFYAAGAGGGGSYGYGAGFGGGSGGLSNPYTLAGCGGGGHEWLRCITTNPDGYGGGGGSSLSPALTVCGGNGFVAVEYWK